MLRAAVLKRFLHPLSVPHPGAAAFVAATKDTATNAPSRAVAKLDNGVTTVAEDLVGNSTAVGVFVKGGASAENSSITGLTSVLQYLWATGGTKNRSAVRLTREAERYGAVINASVSRDGLLVSADGLREDADLLLDLAADVALHSTGTLKDVTAAVEAAAAAMGEQAEADPESFVCAKGIEAAFGNAGVGNPVWAGAERLAGLKPADIEAWTAAITAPENLVVSAVNVDTASFAASAKDYFGAHKAPASGSVTAGASQYVGGEVAIPGATPETHQAIFFPMAGVTPKDLAVTHVIRQALGGGQSFSRGGPGKGMHSKLYTNVLSYPQVHAAASYGWAFGDSGAFGIYGASAPAFAGSLTELLVGQLTSLSSISEVELTRAKNSVKSNYFAAVESPAVLMEENARTLAFHSESDLGGAAYLAAVDAVSAADVAAAVAAFAKSKPSVAMYGDLSGNVTVEKVKKLL